MKKISICLICFCILAAMTACAQNADKTQTDPDNTAETTETATDATNSSAEATNPNADGFVLAYNNAQVYMDEDMENVLAKLGDPRKVFEAPSCAFDGIDKIFAFPGVEIHTYPENDRDFVHTIDFKDDGVTTTEGVYLGQTLDDALAVYGDDYEKELGLYTFAKGKTYLSFLIEDDIIVAITYGLKL